MPNFIAICIWLRDCRDNSLILLHIVTIEIKFDCVMVVCFQTLSFSKIDNHVLFFKISLQNSFFTNHLTTLIFRNRVVQLFWKLSGLIFLKSAETKLLLTIRVFWRRKRVHGRTTRNYCLTWNPYKRNIEKHSGSMVSPLNKQIFSNNFRIFNILHTHFGNLDYALSCRFC